MNWVRTIDWVWNVHMLLLDNFIWYMLLYFNWIRSRNRHGIWSIDGHFNFIGNSVDNRIWTRNINFLDDLFEYII